METSLWNCDFDWPKERLGNETIADFKVEFKVQPRTRNDAKRSRPALGDFGGFFVGESLRSSREMFIAVDQLFEL